MINSRLADFCVIFTTVDYLKKQIPFSWQLLLYLLQFSGRSASQNKHLLIRVIRLKNMGNNTQTQKTNFILCYGEFIKKKSSCPVVVFVCLFLFPFLFVSGNDAMSCTCPSSCSLPADKLCHRPCLKCRGQWPWEIKEVGHRENRDTGLNERKVRATLCI